MTGGAFESAVGALTAALRGLAIPHAIIGGVAVISYGIARATVDVDVTIPGEGVEIDGLIAALEKAGFDQRISDAATFARRSQVLLLRHRASQVPVDLALAWLPFEREMLAATVQRAFAGLSIPVPSVTDLLIMKIVAHRPKDVGDAEQLVRTHAIDFARARRVLGEFCVALEDDERLATLERLAASPDADR